MFQRWNSGAVSFGIQESKTMCSRAKEVQCDANDHSENILRVTKGGVGGDTSCVFKPLLLTTGNKGNKETEHK